MSYPKLIIDLKKIQENARLLADLCHNNGIQPAAVTKVTCGDPRVARAMLDGGMDILAESRLENAYRLRQAGIDDPLLLLRLPMVSQAEEVVELFTCSLNSELKTIRVLNQAAAAKGLVHEIILMVDLGDLREGIWPNELEETIYQLADMDNIQIGRAHV